MISFLRGVVEWVAIPAIMFTGLLLAIVIARSTRDNTQRVAAHAGLLAGLVAGCGFAITQLSNPEREDGSNPGFHFNVLGVIFGLLLGLGSPLALRLIRKVPNLTGLITLLFSGASSLALLSYLFIGNARDFIMLLSVSLLFGVLVYLVFMPASLKEILDILGRAPDTGPPGGNNTGYETPTPPPGYGAPPPGYSPPAGN